MPPNYLGICNSKLSKLHINHGNGFHRFIVDSDIFEGFGDLLFAFQAAKICQKCNIKWHGKEPMMHIIEELYVIPHKQLLHEGPTYLPRS